VSYRGHIEKKDRGVSIGRARLRKRGREAVERGERGGKEGEPLSSGKKVEDYGLVTIGGRIITW